MNTKNFSLEELKTFIKNDKIIFFTFKKCYLLTYSEKNGFKFTELKNGSTKPGELNHSKRGRFYNFKLNSSYCNNYNLISEIETIKEHL